MNKELSNDSLEQKWKIHLYLKVCHTLAEGEESARNLRNRHPPLEHLSVLGKVSGLEEQGLYHTSACFTHLTSTKSHILDISGIGKIFVAGSLSSLLLEKIDGKALGSLEGGLMGILNGYGLNSKKTSYYLEQLRNGKLVVIGWEYASLLKSNNTFTSIGIVK
ncbi:hypothetical protein [Catalinimonas niigatensis]|uniref:hypothetical protein n=1 Tax=Catalinimonas niigatensis TaxID=1397264 RepID=UPI002666C89C|nr:hypothetical protein [Catalinimonas niigatensis]WPP51948.1 hypothetical protein PZB72_06060 [Catalinimonas niigatensis]